ncbi:MAG: YitT family protein [Oscillospiraceae bacterium]|nr:YitT family protein [Oscillospiraceae bacterium]
MKNTIKYFMIVLGSFLTALGLDMFLIPFKMSVGGVSGIGTLLYFMFGIPVFFTVLLLNAVMFAVGFKYLDRKDLLNSMLSAFLLSVFLYMCENIPQMGSDRVLNALFGGAAMGCGIGIVVANGAATGGTDLLALMINKKFPHISIGNVILIADLVVIFATAVAFSDFSLVLYCTLALFVSVKVTDYIVDGMDYSKSVFIISDKHTEISKRILSLMNRGVTGILSKGMYSDSSGVMLMCVVKPREVAKLKNIVKNADKNAFIIISDVSQTLGEGFKENF